jgi:hypothetical protein
MEVIRNYRLPLSFLAAVLIPPGLGGLFVPFRGSFTNAASALLFIIVVVAVAVAGNRFTGFVASIGAALWFDFFLTRPYEKFAINQRSDIQTTVCIVVVGFIVTELAARNRHNYKTATEESDYVTMIHSFAELASASGPTSEMISRAASSIRELLDLRACRFERFTSEPPLARIGPSGEITHVGLLWPVRQIGIPGPEAEILTKWRGEVMGRFVLTPTPGVPVSVERRIVARSLADLVGAALYDRKSAA